MALLIMIMIWGTCMYFAIRPAMPYLFSIVTVIEKQIEEVNATLPDPPSFNWERDYGALYRACPSAFWLAPEPGERKRDVIDVSGGLLDYVYSGEELFVHQAGQIAHVHKYTQLQQASSNPYLQGLSYVHGIRGAGGSVLGKALGF